MTDVGVNDVKVGIIMPVGTQHSTGFTGASTTNPVEFTPYPNTFLALIMYV